MTLSLDSGCGLNSILWYTCGMLLFGAVPLAVALAALAMLRPELLLSVHCLYVLQIRHPIYL